MRVIAVCSLCLFALTSATIAAKAQPMPAPADGSGGGLVGVLTAITQIQQQHGRLTYEDALAAISKPIRYYDFDNNGLSSSEIDVLDSYYAARARADQLRLYLAADLNNDRQVTRDEIQLASRLSTNTQGGGSDVFTMLFQRADTNGDGVLTWDEMSASRAQDRFAVSVRAATIDADPTPDSNFTLADAKTLTDRLFATYDIDKNGVLDIVELRNARVPG